MSEDIRHDGVVSAINGRQVQVRILQSSACSGCKIAGRCSASEMKEKLVDVCTDGSCFEVGQEVVVTTTAAVAQRALLLCFVFPLLLMLGVLMSMLHIGYGEEYAGMAALGVLVPYYVGLWLLRRRVESRVSFAIEPK